MSKVKICPVCNLENNISAILCPQCGTDISGVPVTDTQAPEKNFEESQEESSATVLESKKILQLESVGTGKIFYLDSGATLGREAEEKDFLADFPTVSRKHARFFFSDGWTVEDLNSTNGTWLNEKKLSPGEKFKINPGDQIALSHSCVFRVQ